MLEFKIDDTEVDIILTLSESVTLSSPYYLFVFKHVLTKNEVKFIKSVVEDTSTAQGRYNQFNINPSVLFSDEEPGEWHYKVYEQESAVNTDVAMAGTILEQGKLMLNPAKEFTHKKYNSTTGFKTYNG